MQIINSLHERINENTIICIGNFDGIHTVHQKIIYKTIEQAKQNFCKSMVISFKEHPVSVLNLSKKQKLLMPLDEKINIFEEMGVDYLCLYDFKDVRNVYAESFIEKLSLNYNMQKIICGFNFKFGYKNRGDINLLNRMSSKYNYEVEKLESFKMFHKKVSSTKIRTYIKYGEIEKANEFLGRLFYIKGIVVKGKQLGRQLGFPTANMTYSPFFSTPQNGVYATITEIEGKKYCSMTNIGYNPTFKNKYISIETHMLNFNENLYGKEIKVNFVKKLRNEVLFPDVHSLIDQLSKDKIDAYEITKKYLK